MPAGAGGGTGKSEELSGGAGEERVSLVCLGLHLAAG